MELWRKENSSIEGKKQKSIPGKTVVKGNTEPYTTTCKKEYLYNLEVGKDFLNKTQSTNHKREILRNSTKLKCLTFINKETIQK